MATFFGDNLRNNMLLNSVGMDAVVDFRERALQVPFERFLLLFINFKAFKLTDKVILKFRTQP
jgi:hypothetical protein